MNTSQASADYQLTMNQSTCEGNWEQWFRGINVGRYKNYEKKPFYPTSTCVPEGDRKNMYVEGSWVDPFVAYDAKCNKTRVEAPAIPGASSNGNMTDSENRRSYSL